MPIQNPLKNRLTFGASSEGLAPIVATGPMGERVAIAARTLRGQLAKPIILGADGDFEGMQLTGTADVVRAVNTLLRANHPQADIVVNLFGRDPNPALHAFQEAFLETTFTAALLMAATGDLSTDRLDDLIRVSASVSAAGSLCRGLLVNPKVQPAPIGLPLKDNPFAPGIPEKLLITAERLRKGGCADAVRSALGKWANAVGSATPRYTTDAIDALDPPDGCPGDWMKIRGSGFSDGRRAVVVFTGASSQPVIVPKTDVRAWTDSEIEVRVPKDAVRGPVGILVYPDTSGSPSLGALGSSAAGELGDCFGPAATLHLERALARLAPPISSPPPSAGKANLFTGGIPVLISYEVSPSKVLWPRRKILLSWNVDGADEVRIVARAVTGFAAHELPAIPHPLTYPTGSASVTVPGTRKWRGEYVLSATNRCGKIEASIELEMAIRRGLALGGGGTRGDFQVGALQYLYNEKGFRSDAIAATSVGAVNAVELVMGDDPATATTPARSAVDRLAATWLSLTDNASMWGEQPWLKKAKAQARQTIRSFSIEGLMSLPYAVISNTVNILDLKGLFSGNGPSSIFNMDPIEKRMRAVYDQNKTNKSGIKLRLVAVSLESSDLIMVNEHGGVLERGPRIVKRPAGISPAGPTDVIDGAMASACMPGIFPAVRLNDNMCVDGGLREQVPARVAVQDLGCNEVYSIRLSALPDLWETDPTRGFGSTMARSLLSITLDEISNDDVDPLGGWGEGVKVTDIRPSFNIHDGLVVEPGLIRISIDYGWMRAADIIDMPHVPYAQELSDRITLLRIENWKQAHWANGDEFLDPNRGFTSFMLAGIKIPPRTQLVLVPSVGAVKLIRENCLEIRSLLQQRLITGAPTPPTAVRSAWFTEWETTAIPPYSKDPWAEYITRVSILASGTRPAPI